MKLQNLTQAREYIYQFIPEGNKKLFPGELGLERTKVFCEMLDNPQEKIKTIHIAGTSGKGSTAYLTSILLREAGFKVGLIVKPHIFDIRERYQINNELISETNFLKYLNQMIPVIDKLRQSEYSVPTYAEINAVLAFLIFAQEKVDYGVIETYLGGALDCTNVINRVDKLSVLARIGFDHTKILGNTLSAIAAQKAGIIQKNNQVIALSQNEKINNVFKKFAKEKDARIDFIKKGTTYKNIKQDIKGISFDFKNILIQEKVKLNLESNKSEAIKINLSLLGEFQAENAALALSSVIHLSKRDHFTLSKDVINNAFNNAHFFGRMEVREFNCKKVIFDGAHNPQKMRAFIKSLESLYPNRKFNFLIAIMSGKDISEMLNLIIPNAKHITLSTFFADHQDWVRKGTSVKMLEELVKKKGFKAIDSSNDQVKAFKQALENTDDILIVTGSLYFIGELYRQLDLNN